MANKLRKLSQQQTSSQPVEGKGEGSTKGLVSVDLAESTTTVAAVEDDPSADVDVNDDPSPPHEPGYQPPAVYDPLSWSYRIPLPHHIARMYESQAEQLDIPVETLLSKRLIACHTHTSAKPIYLTDAQRAQLESIFERSLNSSSQLLPLIQRLCEIGVQWEGDPGRKGHKDNPAEFYETSDVTPTYTDEYRIVFPLTLTMLERTHSRRFDPSFPFEKFLLVLLQNLVKRYCGMV